MALCPPEFGMAITMVMVTVAFLVTSNTAENMASMGATVIKVATMEKMATIVNRMIASLKDLVALTCWTLRQTQINLPGIC